MKRITNWALLLVMAVGMMTTSAWAAEKDKASKAEKGPKIGEAAPAFTLQDASGKEHKLSDYRGKIVVLHYQGIRCPWERGYQPILNEVAADFAKPEEGQTPVVFLAINANDGETFEGIAEYKKKTAPIPYPVLKDPGNKVADAYTARFTPHMFIIDAEGTLRYMGGIEKAPSGPGQIGQSEEQYLVPVLSALVNGSEPPQTQTRAIGCTIKRAKK